MLVKKKENPYFDSNLKNYPRTCMSSGAGFLSHYILSQWVDFKIKSDKIGYTKFLYQ